jgi:hypothetical protein
MMKILMKKIMGFLTLLLAIMLANESRASVPGAPLSWEQLVAAASNRLDMGLYQSIKYGAEAKKGDKFFRAEAECSANSNALLSVNGMLVSGPVSLHLGSAAAWLGKTVVYVRLDFADGNKYRFICLVSRDDKLERTRLLDKGSRGGASAMEIDNSNYIYQSGPG